MFSGSLIGGIDGRWKNHFCIFLWFCIYIFYICVFVFVFCIFVYLCIWWTMFRDGLIGAIDERWENHPPLNWWGVDWLDDCGTNINLPPNWARNATQCSSISSGLAEKIDEWLWKKFHLGGIDNVQGVVEAKKLEEVFPLDRDHLRCAINTIST